MKTMFRRWFPVILLLAASVLIAGCTGTRSCGEAMPACPAPPPPPAPPVPVADDDLSYRNQPLDADSFVPESTYAAADPGDSELIARAFENAPPVIPHNVEGLLPITIDENQCAGCHLPDAAADVGATPVPASHFYDIRRDRQLPDLNPANYNCTQCHTSWVDDGDLIENRFEPYFRAREKLKSSNLLEELNEGVR